MATHKHHGPHGHEHHGHHGHPDRDEHGNPADLEEYVARLDDPERVRWQKPARVLAAAGVKPGQTVCEVGAGSGAFALRLSRAVGRRGHVMAVEVEPRMLVVLRARLAAAHAHNVSPILGLPDDPLIPDGSCHRILLVDVYHHFSDGVTVLRRLRQKLRRGGRLVNVDFRPGELAVGPPADHKISPERFLRDARRAGLTLVKEETFLPYQYLLVLR